MGCFSSCADDDLLKETPLSSLNDEAVLSTKAGFEAYITGLFYSAREEFIQDDTTYYDTNFPGTDVADSPGLEFQAYKNWPSYLTPIAAPIKVNWDWAY